MKTPTLKTQPLAASPQEEREAFLARKRQIGPIWVEPLSLAIIWILEELKHPFNEGAQVDADGKPLPLSMRDTARAIYIFNDSSAAGVALFSAGGITAFDSGAITLARSIDPAQLSEIAATLLGTFIAGIPKPAARA